MEVHTLRNVVAFPIHATNDLDADAGHIVENIAVR